MRRVLPRAIVATVIVGAAMGVMPPAGAATVDCGQVITRSTRLRNDVGPCPHNGIVIGADDVTLNLDGHQVFGTPKTGDGAGILVAGHTGVKVMNGVVRDFDGGVVIQGGGGNTVTRIVALHNIGQVAGQTSGALYGDGIAVEASTGNRIVTNQAIDNGPFDGIGLFQASDTDHPFPAGPTTGNVIQGNVVQGNVACRASGFCDNDGIRLEPTVGPGNVVTENSVTGNALDGISLFSLANGNTVSRNFVADNGFSGAVPGDGIRVFGYDNEIASNAVFRNAQDGISVGRRSIAPPGSLPGLNGKNNRIIGNVTGADVHLDLYDSNPDCDANVWRANIYMKASPACTRNR